MSQATNYEDVMESLRQDFLEGSLERLEQLEAVIDGIHNENVLTAETLMDFHRQVHSLKGLGGTFGFPFITLLSHRLEDYLADLSGLSKSQARDVEAYLDALRKVVETGSEPDEEQRDTILRGLPVHGGDDSQEAAPQRDVEVLLVASSKTLTHLVSEKLRNMGFRVVTARSSVDALGMAISTRPDLVIVSATMKGLSGVDMSRAMSAMSTTADIPVMILTSFNDGHQALSGAPDNVEIIHTGDPFVREITSGLEKYNLL
ncbi:MAG: Hpt domain-containing protein [Alphaproteobacteria bacterium]|nr:Hpt domain-containing protein [Alphaproteobacteria bacterium]